jgi:hypothetical protein
VTESDIKHSLDGIYPDHQKHKIVLTRPASYDSDIFEILCNCGRYLEIACKDILRYTKAKGSQ